MEKRRFPSMSEEVYRQLGETMVKRGAGSESINLPEYDEMLRVLFTPEEAEVHNAMPAERFTPDVVAKETGRSEEEVTAILEAMADKGLCMSYVTEGTRFYFGPPLMPGIFEPQFMRGTKTDRDYEIARAINKYRKAEAKVVADAGIVPSRTVYPRSRVIPVDRTVKAEAAVQTYDQVLNYIENSGPIALGTCYCRHEALLVDEKDVCGMPNEVCLWFGTTAEYLIERGIGRRVTKEEAMDVINQAAEAGLVHATVNTQSINFLCNCCRCHCGILTWALRQPKPAEVILHAFEPSFDSELCTVCGICVDRCPAEALTLGSGDVPDWNQDRCIGCGVCASGCPEEAITLVEKVGALVPPSDREALREMPIKMGAQEVSAHQLWLSMYSEDP